MDNSEKDLSGLFLFYYEEIYRCADTRRRYYGDKRPQPPEVASFGRLRFCLDIGFVFRKRHYARALAVVQIGIGVRRYLYFVGRNRYAGKGGAGKLRVNRLIFGKLAVESGIVAVFVILIGNSADGYVKNAVRFPRYFEFAENLLRSLARVPV